MCGICGIYNLKEKKKIDMNLLEQMTSTLRHRGPDEFGFYNDDKIVLGHSRLSIIDLSFGKQPIHNEDKTVWITFNGEIFNYLELREELVKNGHQFYTHTDTEVIIHLYEEKGVDCVRDLNGQFAFAIWDKSRAQLFLARDRVGIRPLFYAFTDDTLLSGNLLSSQGDRVMMANSVEGRFPFLDSRVMEFCAKLPPDLKLKVLKEKYRLKKIAGTYLPGKICRRIKQAYRAPDSASFFNAGKFDYIDDLSSEANVRKTEYFNPKAISQLIKKCRSMDIALISAKDNMAVVGVSQLY